MKKYENYTRAQLIARIEELEAVSSETGRLHGEWAPPESFAVSYDEIYAINPAGYLTYANRIAIEHYQLEAPCNQYGIWSINPEFTPETWSEWLAKIKREKVVRLQHTHHFQNGAIVLFEVNAYYMNNPEYGEVVLCFARNMSDALCIQRKTNFLNLLMDTILSNIFVAIAVKEIFDNFNYIYFNKAAEEFLGIHAEEVLGKSDFEVFPDPRRAHEIHTEDYSTIKNGRSEKLTVEYEKPDGRVRMVNILRLLIKNPDEGASPLLLVMLLDVTQQRQNELDLIKAQEADKMKNAFIANMSHEIRTPLNALVGFSTLLAETDNVSERQEYLSIIQKNSDLLLQLINDILDFAKIESGALDYHFAEVELKNICHAVYVTQSLKMTSDVALLFNADSLPSVRVCTDARRIEQVLLNFLSNAIKCTSQGFIMLSYELENDFVRVSVTDTGWESPKKNNKVYSNAL
ncbi:MAG: PAS domain-containing protein [Parabacteroides sp.]|nr:PAS domain-containing protein [Parabacteroides sp.]